MLFNITIGALIFSYAAWTLIKFVKRSRKGKCAACELNRTCQLACDDVKTKNS
ncbi:FeoB-associated Cys-rich membrane protein [Bacillus licheniformis]|uniref:FeoB-associated Cys-rich membrane protein n=1 Tax=Bacillus licheniformis TaxID=1402 RepID=UPI003CEF1BF7